MRDLADTGANACNGARATGVSQERQRDAGVGGAGMRGAGIRDAGMCGAGIRDAGDGGSPRVEAARLQKIMADSGVASRRKCEAMIAAGRVRVNGLVVREMGCKVPVSGALIEVDGVRIPQALGQAGQAACSQAPGRVSTALGGASVGGYSYALLNKPPRCVSTVSDPRGRATALDAVLRAPPAFGLRLPAGARIYPVGRLDYETTGLLLLTNDGAFAHYATHPSFGVEKAYVAECAASPGLSELARIERGVTLDDGFACAPARVLALGEYEVAVAIREGRNRQVRRMFEAVGMRVVRLRRVAVGGLDLREPPYSTLRLGAWAGITRDEAMRVGEPIAWI